MSHTYVSIANRAKLEALAAEVELGVVVPTRWRDPLFTIKAGETEPSSYLLYRLPVRFNGHVLRHFYPLRRLRRIVREFGPELVHVEEEPGSLALAEMALLKRNGPYKLTFFSWENLYDGARTSILESYNLGRCDGALSGSAEAADVLFRKGFGAPVEVVPQLGVDPIAISPAPQSIDRGRQLELNGFVIGYIGRLVDEKGLRMLVEAAGEVANAQLLFVGRGPLRSELESLSIARGLGGRVHFVDSVPPGKIVDHLRMLDVLVLPSLTTPLWKEQFGHVLIEAMACEIPVLGSSSGAIPWVIGDAGIVFTEGSVHELSAALLRLSGEPGLRRELGKAGRERVLAHFTNERIAAASIEFFRRCLR